LDAAKGDWVYFCDSDDYFIRRESLGLMLEAAYSSGAEAAALSYYSERDGRKHGLPYGLTIIDANAKMDMIANDGGMCFRFMFKRGLLARHGLRFEEGITSKEDLLFSARAIFFADKTAIAPEALYCYTNSPSSATNSRNPAAKRSHETVRKKLGQFAREHGLSGIFEGHQKIHVARYKLFSRITIMTKETSPGKTRYKLFGMLPLLTVK
jgi:glycosyltransferase involved in cell wall biosynthesis